MYLEATLAGLLLVLYKGNSFVLVWSTRWYKALSYVLIYFFYEYVQANTIHAYYVCDEMATSKECNSTYVRMGKSSKYCLLWNRHLNWNIPSMVFYICCVFCLSI